MSTETRPNNFIQADGTSWRGLIQALGRYQTVREAALDFVCLHPHGATNHVCRDDVSKDRPRPSTSSRIGLFFSERILPKVKAASGFVKGYWVDPLHDEGFGFMIFEAENDAIAATPPASDWSAPGVTVEKVNIRRVAVEA